jgi:flagella basal body P-ring formation protein FlgA
MQIWVILSLVLSGAASDIAHAEPFYCTAIREYIEANMPWPPGTVKVDFLSNDTASLPQDKEIVLRVESAGNQDFIGDTVFLVRTFKGGSLLRTESVRTRIEILQDVVIAARGLLAGAVLKENDTRTVRRWVRRMHPQALHSMEGMSGKRLMIQVTPGTEILATMLKEIPLVRKGKMVKIVFDNGLMQIVTVGLSEEDGSASSIIRVRNITSNKIIYARVLSDSLVGVVY